MSSGRFLEEHIKIMNCFCEFDDLQEDVNPFFQPRPLGQFLIMTSLRHTGKRFQHAQNPYSDCVAHHWEKKRELGTTCFLGMAIISHSTFPLCVISLRVI